jgi:hypothetical protein
VKITHVEVRAVKNQDGKEDDCTVAVLEGEKPLILNATNAKTIQRLYDTPYIEDWKNLYVTLYAAKVKAFGEIHDAIRIRTRVPMMSEKHPAWPAVTDALKNGKTTLEKIKQKFNISPADLTKLS